MDIDSTRIITSDVDRLVGFYERLLGREFERRHPLFAELRTPGGSLAISSDQTVPALGDGVAEAGANRSVILDLRVDDVDTTYSVVREWVTYVVAPPRTMPWGNRSLLIRDPDGTLVNLFTRPAT